MDEVEDAGVCALPCWGSTLLDDHGNSELCCEGSRSGVKPVCMNWFKKSFVKLDVGIDIGSAVSKKNAFEPLPLVEL